MTLLKPTETRRPIKIIAQQNFIFSRWQMGCHYVWLNRLAPTGLSLASFACSAGMPIHRVYPNREPGPSGWWKLKVGPKPTLMSWARVERGKTVRRLEKMMVSRRSWQASPSTLHTGVHTLSSPLSTFSSVSATLLGDLSTHIESSGSSVSGSQSLAPQLSFLPQNLCI